MWPLPGTLPVSEVDEQRTPEGLKSTIQLFTSRLDHATSTPLKEGREGLRGPGGLRGVTWGFELGYKGSSAICLGMLCS
jgi:hypothetical protein